MANFDKQDIKLSNDLLLKASARKQSTEAEDNQI